MSTDNTNDNFYIEYASTDTGTGNVVSTSWASAQNSPIAHCDILQYMNMIDAVHIELLLSGIKKHYECFGYTLESYSIQQGANELSTIEYSVVCSKEDFERYVPMFKDEVPDISTDTLLNLAHFEETVSGEMYPHIWTINRKARVIKKSLSAANLT